MLGDGGAWLYEQCIIMAQNNGGSPFDYQALPLTELMDWMSANNRVIERKKEKEGN